MTILLRAATAATLVATLAACNDSSTGGAANGGITTISNTSTQLANDLRGVTFAANGKIYASGHSDANADDRQVVVARFNADGTPDQTFGDGDGVLTLNLAENGGDEQSLGIVELGNGDIVLAVHVGDGNGGQVITADDNPSITGEREEGQSIFLVRLSNSGEFVTSFGDNGRAEVVLGWADAENGNWPVPTFSSVDGFSDAGFPEDTVFDLELDSRAGVERLVVFGYGPAPAASGRTDRDRYIARYLASDGSVDASFNGGVAHSYNSEDSLADNGRRGSVEADGSIVSAGYTNLGDDLRHHVILVRLNADGTPDAGFGDFGPGSGPGIAVFNPFQVDGGFAECYATAQLSDGSYVTTGYGGATGGADVPSTQGFASTVAQDVVTFRIGSDGVVNTNYGNNGSQAFQSEPLGLDDNEERGRDMIALLDDRTIQVGRFGGEAAVYVVNSDGQLDTRVDDDGIIIPAVVGGIGAQFYAVALSNDGNRVAVTSNADDNGARLLVLDVSGN